MTHPPILLTGPTTVGKTSVALELAARLDGELVAADKYHLVDEFPLSTGVADLLHVTPSPRVHLYQTVHPLSELPGPSEYCLLAAEACAQIRARGKTPILEGCVGNYAKALSNYIWGPGLDGLCVVGLLPPDSFDAEGKMKRRFDKAVEMGLVEEAARGLARGYGSSEIMQTNIVGNIAAYVRGEMSLPEARDKIITTVLDYTPRDLRRFSRTMHGASWIEADPADPGSTAARIIGIAASGSVVPYTRPIGAAYSLPQRA